MCNYSVFKKNWLCILFTPQITKMNSSGHSWPPWWLSASLNLESSSSARVKGQGHIVKRPWQVKRPTYLPTATKLLREMAREDGYVLYIVVFCREFLFVKWNVVINWMSIYNISVVFFYKKREMIFQNYFVCTKMKLKPWYIWRLHSCFLHSFVFWTAKGRNHINVYW